MPGSTPLECLVLAVGVMALSCSGGWLFIGLCCWIEGLIQRFLSK